MFGADCGTLWAQTKYLTIIDLFIIFLFQDFVFQYLKKDLRTIFCYLSEKLNYVYEFSSSFTTKNITFVLVKFFPHIFINYLKLKNKFLV